MVKQLLVRRLLMKLTIFNFLKLKEHWRKKADSIYQNITNLNIDFYSNRFEKN